MYLLSNADLGLMRPGVSLILWLTEKVNLKIDNLMS